MPQPLLTRCTDDHCLSPLAPTKDERLRSTAGASQPGTWIEVLPGNTSVSTWPFWPDNQRRHFRIHAPTFPLIASARPSPGHACSVAAECDAVVACCTWAADGNGRTLQHGRPRPCRARQQPRTRSVSRMPLPALCRACSGYRFTAQRRAVATVRSRRKRTSAGDL